jgi:2-amino-1-hydroxyethylphosphonate dioxygenase (glycine-forming)
MDYLPAIDEIFSLYENFGAQDYIGEPVSQFEHMSQAAQLAILDNHDDEIVLAAFFHDIGHLCVSGVANPISMGGYGVKSHEKIGADYLRVKGFPERIAKLVENHVQAKRYLTYKHPEYYKSLSEASKKTLDYQGGIMSPAEAESFETDPLFAASIMLRRWDELAKEVNVACIDLTKMKDMAQRVLTETMKDQRI